MIKKKTKERKTRVKKITRGGELNIGPFVPPNYGIMTVDELEQLKTEITELKIQNNEIIQLKDQIEELKRLIITNSIIIFIGFT